jgi:tRNA threonylcarbamoyladenosine biosynthesis protein TsaE
VTGALRQVTRAPGETRALGCALAPLLEPGDVILVCGPLGAGKTELAKGIAEGLGVGETVVSPTFTIAREYAGRLRLLHVDVYRLDRAQELLDLGLEDLAASERDGDEAVTVVEWGDAVAGFLPADHLSVQLDFGDGESDSTRMVCFEVAGASWGARSAALAAVLNPPS